MGNAREAALRSLYACHHQGGWSDGALRREMARAKLDARDAALCSRLCYGVLQRQYLLDFYLGGVCERKLTALEPKVLEILRLGAYQLLYLDKVPVMAAVNEAVELTKRHAGNPRAAGMVNAVLRNLDRRRDRLPEPTGNWADRVSVRTSHPVWLVKEFSLSVGEAETEALLDLNNQTAATFAQVNTLKTSAQALRSRLEREGVEATEHPWMPDCLLLEKTGDLAGLDSFREGLFYVQDPAARLSVWAAGPKPGERALDLCAAPGGKSFAAAIAMEDQGTVTSRDVYPRKVETLAQGAQRLGLSCLDAQVGDATRGRDRGCFDLVIADVPCSGLGIIRKKPEIRYKDPAEFPALLPVQAAILERGAQAVAPGGRLLYATCTLRRQENEAQVEQFLDKHKDFTLTPLELPAPFGRAPAGWMTLWPQRHGTDGFFFALLGREG